MSENVKNFKPNFSQETILNMDAISIANAIKSEKITSFEVVSTFIEHAKNKSPH